MKIFGIFHDSDVRRFLTAVCLFSLFLGGLSRPYTDWERKRFELRYHSRRARKLQAAMNGSW
jgi:hypothetical protein